MGWPALQYNDSRAINCDKYSFAKTLRPAGA